MANGYSSSKSKAIGTIDTVGALPEIQVHGARLVDLSLDFDTLTFVGTIKLQRLTSVGQVGNDDSYWKTVASYTSSSEITFRSASARRYRLYCSTATSGTCLFEMVAGNKEGN